jgi:peptidoglycan/LPS O-acetylase OafA/YrhL
MPSPAPPALGHFKFSLAASAHLDAIRSIAAVAVMFHHLRNLFFVNYAALEQSTPMVRALYFVTRFGHEAVMVFFVLSGLLISSVIARRHTQGRWSWREYLVDRSVRLYLVLIPGLVCGAIWDLIGMRFAPNLYTHPLPSFGSGIAANAMHPRDFIGNAFFLQTILVPTFGSNGPLWSLSNEWWYYILFPSLLSVVISRKHPKVLIASLIVAGSVIALMPPAMRFGFTIWLLGSFTLVAISAARIRSRSGRFAFLCLSGVAFVLMLVRSRTTSAHPDLSDFLVGITFAAFLYGVLHGEIVATSYRKIASCFSGFSYTLYIFHFPFLLCLRAAFCPQGDWQPNGKHLMLGIAIGIATLIYAFLVSLVTERKTAFVRCRIELLIH